MKCTKHLFLHRLHVFQGYQKHDNDTEGLWCYFGQYGSNIVLCPPFSSCVPLFSEMPGESSKRSVADWDDRRFQARRRGAPSGQAPLTRLGDAPFARGLPPPANQGSPLRGLLPPRCARRNASSPDGGGAVGTGLAALGGIMSKKSPPVAEPVAGIRSNGRNGEIRTRDLLSPRQTR